MPKLSMGGKVKHYAYTPEGKAQYERDKAALKMSPGMLINSNEPLPAPKPAPKRLVKRHQKLKPKYPKK